MAHEHAPLRRPSVVERRPPAAALLQRSNIGAAPAPGHAAPSRSVYSSSRSSAGTAVSVSAPVSIQCARISKPSDPAELEAKQTARKIVQANEPARPPRIRPEEEGKKKKTLVQRAEAPARTAAPVSAVAAAGGTPLPSGVRRFMEPRFGADFGNIRVHTGEAAARQSAGLNAHAFTVGGNIYFGRNQFQPESAGGRELIAHELTHSIQQGAAVQQGGDAAVSRRSEPRVQRLGIGDALDWFADQARIIPGFRLLTIVLGVNPINMAPVARSGANILRGLLELIPLVGPLIAQALGALGLVARLGAWIDGRVRGLGLDAAALKRALARFLDSLSLSDLLSPGAVWTRAKRIFTEPIDRLIAFGKSLLGELRALLRQEIVLPLARMAQRTRGYDLLRTLLGEDPITGEPVPHTPENLIRGFLKLIGQEEVWANIEKANAIPRVAAWFQGAKAELVALVKDIPSRFRKAIDSLDVRDFINPFKVFGTFAAIFNRVVLDFTIWAGKNVWRLLEIVVEAVCPSALPWIKRTGAAFRSILRNPAPFAANLNKAARLAFSNFGDNFLTHLKASLFEWLLGELPGVHVPKAWSVAEFAKFGFSVLGLSWENIRLKLVRAIGEPAVKVLEGSFKAIEILVRDGPMALLDSIKNRIASLRDQALQGMLDVAIEMVVTRALPRVLAYFIPYANIVAAILSIYNAVMFFVDKASKIIQVVKIFLDSIVAIAEGSVDQAAARIEKTLASIFSLGINFLFALVGLGKVSAKIRRVLDRIRAPIDKALDKAVAGIVALAKKLGKLAIKAGIPQDPDARLRLAALAAMTAANGLGTGFTKPLMVPILKGIKTAFGLTSIDVYEQGGTWWVELSINPKKKFDLGVRTAARPGTTPAASKLPPMKPVPISFKCNIKKYKLAEFEQQLKGQQAGLNKISIVDWENNREAYETSGRGSNMPAELIRETYADDLRLQGKKEEEIEVELLELAALHEPDLVAGGFNVVKSLGSRYINCSIGVQWKKKVKILEDKVNALTKAEKKKRRINVKLTAVSYTPEVKEKKRK